MHKRTNRNPPERLPGLANGRPCRDRDRDARREPRGLVVDHLPGTHEVASQRVATVNHRLAAKLAALNGYEIATNCEAAARYPGPKYFVPRDTVVGLDAAKAVGIRSEHDLFGGVVPHAFAATKVITHPLVQPSASAPAGWSHLFSRRIADIVHMGFSAFTPDDARCAGAILLESGSIRLKPARAASGRAQVVVSTHSELETALRAVDLMELSRSGLVIEGNLSEVTTYSVGQVRVADLVESYYGTQHVTRDNRGALVYGGSDLMVVRGEFQTLLGLDLPADVRLAVLQAQAYDAAAMDCFAGMFASRRNYDVARGRDAGR